MTAAPGTTSAEQEIGALRRLIRELDKLDPSAQMRVLVWLEARYPTRAEDHYPDPPAGSA
jgi:hypothetical protein